MRSIQKCSSITALWAELVAEELVRLGVKLVCIAPGSRSTPLVAACARHEGLEKVVCQDERSAGFYALGYGRAAGVPAAVITTSGSAVANLFPSIVEAANDRVPLLILTADRPPELRAVGANQTIDQTKIFGGYVRSFVDMPAPDDRISLRFVLSTVDQAFTNSVGHHKGPVHLNFMFREPFEPDVDQPFDRSVLKSIAAWAEQVHPLCRQVDSQTVTSLINDSKSGIIVCGAIYDLETESAVVKLAEKIGWPILPDVLSNLRFRQSPAIANFFDFALLDSKLESHVSDVVLQVGGRIVSKRLQTFLDRGLSKAHIYIGNEPERLDPGCVVTHRVEGPVKSVIANVVKQSREGMDCFDGTRNDDQWLENSRIVQDEFKRQNIDASFSEISVARSIVRSLSSDHILFCSVSMPVRDVNMFAEPHVDPPRLYANRGASGIDGIVSSACGVSRALKKRCVLLCGDLTFLYDTNGLGLIKSLDRPFVIVVVNNNGGGIFTMLNIHKQDIFTPYWDAEHDVQLSKLCAAYVLKHVRVDTLEHWNDVVGRLPNTTEHMIMEVVSDKWENKKAHDHIREAVQQRFA